MNFLLEIFPSFSWLNFCKIFPSRVRFLVVSLRLHLRLFLVLPQNFLSHTSPKPHPTTKISKNPLSLTVSYIPFSLPNLYFQLLANGHEGRQLLLSEVALAKVDVAQKLLQLGQFDPHKIEQMVGVGIL